MSKMTEIVTVMRGNAQLLCASPEEKVPIELSVVHKESEYTCTELLLLM